MSRGDTMGSARTRPSAAISSTCSTPSVVTRERICSSASSTWITGSLLLLPRPVWRHAHDDKDRPREQARASCPAGALINLVRAPAPEIGGDGPDHSLDSLGSPAAHLALPCPGGGTGGGRRGPFLVYSVGVNFMKNHRRLSTNSARNPSVMNIACGNGGTAPGVTDGNTTKIRSRKIATRPHSAMIRSGVCRCGGRPV